MDVSGKVVIVTGASQGIGLAAARVFAARGAKVALVARSAHILKDLAAELPDALAVPADMSDTASVRAMIETVVQHYGRIDVLVNNAARAMHVPLEKASLDDYRALLELNVVNILAAMQTVIPIMRKQGGGVILNVTSGVSKLAIPNVGPYASSKSALNTLTRTARGELAKDNIVVGLVYPGFTDTNFHKNAIAYELDFAFPPPAKDPVDDIAAKIVEASLTGAEETFAASLQPK